MDLTDELLDNSPIGSRQDEQAVIICLQFPIGKFENKKAQTAIFDLDGIVREVIETSGVGIYDGFEFKEGPDEELVKFFIRGEDANSIYRKIKPILEALPSLPGFYIIKRYTQFTDDLLQMSS
jgi:hypothetical protein